MNQHLQSLLNFIQHSPALSNEEKSSLLNAVNDADKEFEITAFKLDRTEKVKRTTAILLEETIEELDQKRKAVEAQNRELEIESALERVRTVAMSMRTPNDLLDICEILYAEFQLLGFNELRNAMINIYEDDITYFLNYDYAPRPGKTVTHIPYNFHPLINKQVSETKNAGDAFIEFSFAGNELKDFRALRKNNGEQDDPKLDDCSSLHYYFYSFGTGSIGISTYNAVTDEKKNVLKRFRNVFDLAYKRYIDIAKAEAQAREAQIEAALERVRAKTMAMHSSEDVGDTVATMFNEFVRLGIQTNRCGILIFSDDPAAEVWTAKSNPGGKANLIIGKLDMTVHPLLQGIHEAWRKNQSFYSYTMEGDDLRNYYQALNDLQYYPTRFDMETLPSKEFHSDFYFPEGAVFAFTPEFIPDETSRVIKRFAAVFGQTYRRYLDLQKAEAQARESQIQLALERVRARTMAMQKSDELSETVYILFQQFKELGENPDQATIGIINENEWVIEYWVTMYGNQNNKVYKFSIDEPNVTNKIYKAWKENKSSSLIDLSGDALSEFMSYRAGKGGAVVNPNEKRRIINVAFFSKGLLNVQSNEERSKESIQLLERFAMVFEQTYTRFLDLQKAEAQAREAQIEAALERVRSRTMAMQRSEELAEVATLLFQQVKVLGVPQLHCGFSIFEIDDKEFTWYPGSPGGDILPPSKIPLTEHPVFISFNESRKRGDELFVYEKGGEYQADHYRYMHALPGVGEILQKMLDAGLSFPTFQIDHVANFSHGNLMFITSEHFPEMHNVFKRFAKVFEQTYTRFLDLQKAEAQARESQIQLALERVRARTMAMQHSDELKEAAALLFQQAKALGVPAYSCGYNIWEKDDKEFTSWMSTQDGSIINGVPNIPLTEDANFIRYVESKEKGESFFVLELRGGRMQEHYKYLKTIPAFKAYFDYAISVGFDLPETQIHNLANFSHGNLLFISLAPCPEFHNVFKRFAAVFDQTYTRFLDLQRAEAQAREATKQASLDRVRGQIASMRSTEDLERITPLIWHELTMLGVPFIRCGVLIIDEAKAEAHIYLSSPDGHSLAAMNLPLQSNTLTANSVEYWRKGLVYTGHWSQENFIHWMQSMIEQGQVQNPETYQGAAKPPESLHLHFVPFTQGMLYVGNTDLLTDDEIDLVKSLAEAFSIAYARYEDFTKLEKAKQSIEITLTELKATQTQLIQSEKMASLGELTAGIAHEIQNPLNFVNNFSEVNRELLAEMTEEIEKGNFEEAKSLAKDVTDNEEKINHHGKRADAIVKGMLQHSRSSTGVKEPTDINALADEYLRLAYHGLRAKDKDFNATMKTDFDNSIGKINIIPQDIGRVLLNLYNNAFYAVSEKEKDPRPLKGSEEYDPTVTVNTRSVKSPSGDLGVLVTVSDNGNGIPQKVVDKIFQPFFTTKPTGQGTGLGLSLSYDIVKAHGGEIKINTKEGEGSEFIIQLPIIN